MGRGFESHRGHGNSAKEEQEGEKTKDQDNIQSYFLHTLKLTLSFRISISEGRV